jgi:hypothetical protein
MKRITDALRELEDMLMVAFKVLSLCLAIIVVLIVEGGGIMKVWMIVTHFLRM